MAEEEHDKKYSTAKQLQEQKVAKNDYDALYDSFYDKDADGNKQVIDFGDPNLNAKMASVLSNASQTGKLDATFTERLRKSYHTAGGPLWQARANRERDMFRALSTGIIDTKTLADARKIRSGATKQDILDSFKKSLQRSVNNKGYASPYYFLWLGKDKWIEEHPGLIGSPLQKDGQFADWVTNNEVPTEEE